MHTEIWLPVLVAIPTVVLSSLQIYEWFENRHKKSKEPEDKTR